MMPAQFSGGTEADPAGGFPMATHAMDAEKPGRWARIGHTLLHELREVLPPTIFFFVGFNLILLTTRLILADYLIQLTGFLIATMSALIVGKVVLVADMMPFLRRFDALLESGGTVSRAIPNWLGDMRMAERLRRLCWPACRRHAVRCDRSRVIIPRPHCG